MIILCIIATNQHRHQILLIMAMMLMLLVLKTQTTMHAAVAITISNITTASASSVIFTATATTTTAQLQIVPIYAINSIPNKVEESRAYKLFVNGIAPPLPEHSDQDANAFEKPFAIALERKDLVQAYLAQYPVFYFTFEEESIFDYDDLLALLTAEYEVPIKMRLQAFERALRNDDEDNVDNSRKKIMYDGWKNDFKELSWLKKATALDNIDNEQQQQQQRGRRNLSRLRALRTALTTLINVVSGIFEKKVFLIIDNYDNPIDCLADWMSSNSNTPTGNTVAQKKEALDAYKSILNELHKNYAVEKILLTTKYPLSFFQAFTSFFGPNNEKFSAYFGVKETELNELIEIIISSTETRKNQFPPQQIHHLKELYGYHFLAHNKNLQRTTTATYYRPASIFNFLRMREVQVFFDVNTVAFIGERLSVDHKLLTTLQYLLLGGSTQIMLPNMIDICALKEANTDTNMDQNNILLSLFYSGILIEQMTDSSDTSSETANDDDTVQQQKSTTERLFGMSKNAQLVLPNNETKALIFDQIKLFLNRKRSINLIQLGRVADTLSALLFDPKSCDYDALIQEFEKLIAPIPFTKPGEFHEAKEGVSGNEDIFHSLMNTVALEAAIHGKMGSEVYIKGFRTIGEKTYKEGWIDILLAKNSVGLVIEMKCSISSTSTNADIGLEQALSYAEHIKFPLTVKTAKYLSFCVKQLKNDHAPKVDGKCRMQTIINGRAEDTAVNVDNVVLHGNDDDDDEEEEEEEKTTTSTTTTAQSFLPRTRPTTVGLGGRRLRNRNRQHRPHRSVNRASVDRVVNANVQ